MAQLLKAGGRKYAVVIRTLELGFMLSLVGLFVIAVVPNVAAHVGTILGSFGLLGSASIVAYNGANAAADWHTTPSPKAPPRQSGTVPEPPHG